MSTPAVTELVAHGINVTAIAVVSPENSDPTRQNHVFVYTITISNDGDLPAQLMNRHWIIIDGSGRREDVNGPGVVGKTPRILPGESFQYQSFCQLKTQWGTMEGSYQMKRDNGEEFSVNIPRFYLKTI